MTGVLQVIAEGVKFTLRAALCLALSCLVVAVIAFPWRWYSTFWSFKDMLVTRSITDKMDAYIKNCCWIILSIVIEVLTFCAMLPTLCSWRLYFVAKETWAKGRVPWRKEWDFDLNGIVWDNFFALIRDIPYLIMAVLNVAMVWHAPQFLTKYWKAYRRGALPHELRKVVFDEFADGVVTVYLIPVLAVLLVTGYRIPVSYASYKDPARKQLMRRVLVKQMFLVFVDAFFGVFALLTLAMLIRVNAYRREWVDAKGDARPRRRRAVANFFLSFRDWLGVAMLVLLIPSVYRFVLAVQELLLKCGDQADPVPMLQLTSAVPEAADRGSCTVHLKGRKPQDFTFSQAKLYMRNASFFERLGKVYGGYVPVAVKAILPYDLVKNQCLDPGAFKAGESDFEATLTFRGRMGRRCIKRNFNSVGGGYRVDVTVEYGKGHEGTLFHLGCALSDFIDAEDEGKSVHLAPRDTWEYDVGKMTTAQVRAKGTGRVRGECFCDVVFTTAALQLWKLAGDLAAIVLFVLLHAVPWRAAEMYRDMFAAPETAQQRRVVHLAKTFLHFFDRRDVVSAAFVVGVERAVRYSGVPPTCNDPCANAKHRQRRRFNDTTYWQGGPEQATAFKDMKAWMKKLRGAVEGLQEEGAVDLASEGRVGMQSVLDAVAPSCNAALASYRAAYDVGVPVVPEEEETEVQRIMRTQRKKLGGVDPRERNDKAVAGWLKQCVQEEVENAQPSKARGAAAPTATEPVAAEEEEEEEDCAKKTFLNEDQAYDDAAAAAKKAAAAQGAVMDRLVAAMKAKEEALAGKPYLEGRAHLGGFGGFKASVFGTVVQLGKDLFAVLGLLLVVALVYRIPVLYTSSKTKFSVGNWHLWAFWNAREVFVDLVYVVKAALVLAGVRNALPLCGSLMEHGARHQSYNALRFVVDWYFALWWSDVCQLLTFVVSFKAVRWLMGGVVTGVLTPGTLVESVLFPRPLGKVVSAVVVLSASAWTYGWPAYAVHYLATGATVTALAPLFAPLGAVCLLHLISGVRRHRAHRRLAAARSESEKPTTPLLDAAGRTWEGAAERVVERFEIIHARFVRLNWFNGLQFMYTTCEAAGLVAMYAAALPAGHTARRVADAALLRMPAGGPAEEVAATPVGLWLAFGTVAVYYAALALPIVVLALGNKSKSNVAFCRHNSWVFFYSLCSAGLHVVTIYSLTRYVMCPGAAGTASNVTLEDAPCYPEEEAVAALALAALQCLVFFAFTTSVKIPEYTTSFCTRLDIVFVEAYEAVVRFVVVAAAIGCAMTVHLPDVACAIALAAAVVSLLWTALYGKSSGKVHVCSVGVFTLYREVTLGVAAVAILALRASVAEEVTDAMPALPWAGFGAGVAAVLLVGGWRVRQLWGEDSDELDITPEQVQQSLLDMEAALHCMAEGAEPKGKGKAGAQKAQKAAQGFAGQGFVGQGFAGLAPDFNSAAWRRSVRSSVRPSGLALALMRLEHHARLASADSTFLALRGQWCQGVWKVVDDDDQRHDLSTYEAADLFTAPTFFPYPRYARPVAFKNDGHGGAEDLGKVMQSAKQFGNAIAARGAK